MNSFQQELNDRKKSHLIRKLPTSECTIDFLSNDYLGLARSESLFDKINANTEQSQQNGSTGSRLLSGNSKHTEQVEAMIANYHGFETALIFNSGYTANLGLLSAIGKRNTTIVTDELIHASLIDGIRLSQAQKIKFKHNDINDLTDKLKSTDGQKFVVIESIYSMDGDLAPIEEILAVSREHQAELIVDEAHAAGVVGNSGEGYCTLLGIQGKVFAAIVTYGKAFGIHGAAVLGPKWLKEYLINFSRPFIYTTAPSPHQIAAIKGSYSMMKSSNQLRKDLRSVVDYFVKMREQFSHLNWLPSNTAIQSLIIPGNEEVVKMSTKLQDQGISILPIRCPTVPEGKERLRISLHAFNTTQEIDHLFQKISSCQLA